MIVTECGRLWKISPYECMQQCLEGLRKAKDTYSDEIPQDIVHSTSENNRYKVRAVWWSIIMQYVGVLRKRELLPAELFEGYDKVISDYISHRNENHGLIIKEDIDAANSLLEDMIRELESHIRQE